MTLTGPWFLGAIVVVTVAAFLVVVMRWPSLAGRRPSTIAARVGMLLTVNVLVLLTAATQLNAQFLFFTDWTDLRGAFGGATTSTALTRGGTASEATSKQVGGTAATAGGLLPPLPLGRMSPSGVISSTVTGPLRGITGPVMVQPPPGYTYGGHAPVRYPGPAPLPGSPGGHRPRPGGEAHRGGVGERRGGGRGS